MIIIPPKTYGAILIDPPWFFRTYDKKKAVAGRKATDPYKTMQLHEIAGLPIPKLLAKNGVVIMWDNDSIPGTLDFFIQAWGLRLGTKNAFIWNKGSIGMGYYSRKQCEVAHLLVRGRPPRRDKGVRQYIEAPRREHSRKPDEIYGLIERLVDGPYLEMFARQRVPGWDSWGDEVDKYEAAKEIRNG